MSSQENIIWRTLSSSDFDKGYTNLLSELSTVGSVEKSEFLSRLHQIQSYPDYYILVAEDNLSFFTIRPWSRENTCR
ncbi:Glucosamine 6-phosphate N-acetyltransferase 1 [Galdieria sulphuraria]|nr:Glucosamine 6-phosphate N-acetyltransferase 1 [Galdieria sulphuraria]